jgi:hypothetical protein
VCSLNGYIGRWALPSFQLIKESVIEPNASYYGVDFVYLENDKDLNSVVVTGSQTDPEGPEGMDKVKITRIV